MIDSVLQKFVDRQTVSEARSLVLPNTTAHSDEDATESQTAFGCMRGGPKERALMLELRLRNGNIRAIPYSYIEAVHFDPSEGITLHVGDRPIRIRGRHLNTGESPDEQLFSSICRNRVLWAREGDRTANIGAGHNRGAVIDSIEW